MHDSSTEKSIFYAALDLPDVASRCSYLDVACNNNEALRQRIEALLKAAEQGGGFMRRRAIDCIADEAQHGWNTDHLASEDTPDKCDLDTQAQRSVGVAGDSESDPLIGQTLSHYRIDSLIGSGGMGRVYLAEDQRLGRKVALKLIAPRWEGEGRARFLREAQLAAALDHPNVRAIYDIGEDSGKCFIAMQYIDGQTLEQLIGGRPLAVDALLAIALQVADGLSAAHQRGIVHRDIKSRNIMMTSGGQAIVLDFGLAKLFAPESQDAALADGMVGTPAFMSPEQARGDEVDCRSDIFSFGAVLYHMATGTTPFRGASSTEVIRAVTAETHPPAQEFNSEVPHQLAAVIDRALCKAPADRYQSVEGLASALRSIESQISLRKHPASVRARRQRRTIAMVVTTSLLVAIGWFAWQAANVRWARKQVPVIAELARAGRSFDAYDLAVHVRKFLPNHLALNPIMIFISDSLTVTSEPTGARVYLKRFVPGLAGESLPATFVGTTPISKLEVARGSYVVSVEKEGYDAFRRTWFNAVSGSPESPIQPKPPIQIKAILTPTEKVPAGMVFVPGDKHRLPSWNRPTEVEIDLSDYWIDRCEVTNRQYKKFVDQGGYSNANFWTHAFVKDGRTLPREEAIGELVDSSGQAGPRNWSGGTYPEGKADHPVSNITWYEAAAYAAFREKSLPTIFQWEMAAQHGANNNPLGVTMPWGMHERSINGRANLNNTRGTVPVGSMEFGMSPYGCFEMAGNVAEWCLNETSQGFIVSGGSWNSISSAWGLFGNYPAFHSSAEIGFRCVWTRAGSTGDQGAMRIDLDGESPQIDPAPEAEVRKWFAHYEYEELKRTIPLEAHVATTETDEWRRERIEYNGADGERALAYLYVPKHFPGPHQVVHLRPAGDVAYGFRTVPQSIEGDYSSFVRSGRAVFAVVLRGYPERENRAGFEAPNAASIEYVDLVAREIIDMRRGLDYLLARDDVDARGVAFLDVSDRGRHYVLPAIESRYRAVIFAIAGIDNSIVHREVNGNNFAPLILAPKLHVRGRYDEANPLKTAAEPLYSLLTEPKEKILYDGGHRFDLEDFARDVNTWLDKTLGPVRRN